MCALHEQRAPAAKQQKNSNKGRKHSQENIDKRIEKQKKINAQQLIEVQKLLSTDIYQKDIAKMYNVSPRVISKIKLGIY